MPTCPMAMPSHTPMAEFDRHAARQTDAVLDGLRDVVQVVVPRHALPTSR